MTRLPRPAFFFALALLAFTAAWLAAQESAGTAPLPRAAAAEDAATTPGLPSAARVADAAEGSTATLALLAGDLATTAGLRAGDLATTAVVFIPPEPYELLDSLAAHIASLESFSVTVHTSATLRIGPECAYKDTRILVAVQRPNRFSANSKTDDLGTGDVACDGRHVYAYDPGLYAWSESPAPPDFDTLFSDTRMIDISGVASIVTLLLSNARDLIREQITDPQYVGYELLDNRMAHHLRYPRELTEEEGGGKVFVDIWISDHERPLLLREMVDMSERLRASFGPEGPPDPNVFSGIETKYSEWRLNPPLGNRHFLFAPPPDSIKAASLDEAYLYRRPGKAVSGSSYPLRGKPAPEIDLALLDGGRLHLAAPGREVTVLLFWVTWSPASERALPLMADLAAQFEGEPVSFYAINIKEPADVIRRYLEEKQIAAPSIALDKVGYVSGEYQAPVPSILVIDTQGVIRDAHVGVPPKLRDLRRTLEAQIRVLSRGGDLLALRIETPLPTPAVTHTPAPTPTETYDQAVESQFACRMNLLAIQRAKEAWQKFVNIGPDNTPRWDDLLGVGYNRTFLDELPRCPSGGTYSINPINKNPSCSHIHESHPHTYPQ